jgi:hypothetical protein
MRNYRTFSAHLQILAIAAFVYMTSVEIYYYSSHSIFLQLFMKQFQ